VLLRRITPVRVSGAFIQSTRMITWTCCHPSANDRTTVRLWGLRPSKPRGARMKSSRSANRQRESYITTFPMPSSRPSHC